MSYRKLAWAPWVSSIGFASIALLCFVACATDPASIDDDGVWEIDFSPIEAAALRSAAAYDSPTAIQARFGEDTFVCTIPRTDVQVFHELTPAHQWIAVRGTANLENVLRDVDYEKTLDPKLGIWLHRGIAEDARACLEVIRPRLRKELPIAVTGHSLGGGIAALLAAWLSEEQYSVLKTVTFGQPMITNEAGVKRLEALPILRVVDHDDVIPLLPAPTVLSVLRGEFRQFGPELRLSEGVSFELMPARYADRRVETDFWDHLGHESIADHHVARYVEKIEALANEQRRARSLAGRSKAQSRRR